MVHMLWRYLHGLCLKGSSEANCSLNEPYQQSCNFSLYITPWVSNISLGESIVLTCPGNYSQLKWQEITSTGVSILNASEATITYHANKLMKMVWSLCVVLSLGAEKLVLGIGKVIVRNSSSTLASTFSFDSSIEQDFGATSTKKEIVSDSTTNITPVGQKSFDEQMNRDLIVILVLTSSALLFCLGMCLLLIKYMYENWIDSL